MQLGLQTIGRALVRELVRKMLQKQIIPSAQSLLAGWLRPASIQNRNT